MSPAPQVPSLLTLNEPAPAAPPLPASVVFWQKDPLKWARKGFQILEVGSFVLPWVYYDAVGELWRGAVPIHVPNVFLCLGLMYMGVKTFGKAAQALKPSQHLPKSLPPPPLANADKMTLCIDGMEKMGFRTAAQEARSIVQASQMLLVKNASALSLIDKAFQEQMDLIAQLSAQLESPRATSDKSRDDADSSDEGRHSRRERRRERREARRERHHGASSEGLKLGDVFQVGKSDDLEGVRITGDIQIGKGKDFEGIRIGDLVIGKDYRQAKRPSVTVEPNPALAPGTTQPAEAGKALTHIRPVEVPAAFASNPRLLEAARHATEELCFIREKCDELLSVDKVSSRQLLEDKLKQHIEIERKIQEELQSLKV